MEYMEHEIIWKYLWRVLKQAFPDCIFLYNAKDIGFEITAGDINTYLIRKFAETNPLADCLKAVHGQGKQREFTCKLSECTVVPRKIVLAEEHKNIESIDNIITLIKLCYPDINIKEI